ncbi:hypothetical protein N7539_004812 [Penicillium diatomitis]|uniref:Uncharacterized protein n=1 Tax=Penicillium diatomitis TaxID=2819901 RepID=A0A9W9X5N8_9EURO|nr:uncharacterized protein N7539_004812 [Penicillium diatomitis]KAJ5484824.1 hypothetical protein N7539_004812 [Penicillium diatomitis]
MASSRLPSFSSGDIVQLVCRYAPASTDLHHRGEVKGLLERVVGQDDFAAVVTKWQLSYLAATVTCSVRAGGCQSWTMKMVMNPACLWIGLYSAPSVPQDSQRSSEVSSESFTGCSSMSGLLEGITALRPLDFHNEWSPLIRGLSAFLENATQADTEDVMHVDPVGSVDSSEDDAMTIDEDDISNVDIDIRDFPTPPPSDADIDLWDAPSPPSLDVDIDIPDSPSPPVTDVDIDFPDSPAPATTDDDMVNIRLSQTVSSRWFPDRRCDSLNFSGAPLQVGNLDVTDRARWVRKKQSKSILLAAERRRWIRAGDKRRAWMARNFVALVRGKPV